MRNGIGMATLTLTLAAALVGGVTAGRAAPKPFEVSGTFAGEHGATNQPSGQVTGRFDPATHELSYKISFDGLSGPVTAAHFHGPASPGTDAGVLKPINGPYTSPVSGEVTLDRTQVRELRHGQVYVNLHTAAHPDGEARAQLQVGTGSS